MTPFKKIFLLMLIILCPQIGSGFDFVPLTNEEVDQFKMKITVHLCEIDFSKGSVSTSSSPNSVPVEEPPFFYVSFIP